MRSRVETRFDTDLSGRLKLLTAIRCLMITLLLGTGLAVNLNDASTFENPSYEGLTLVIIATYVATVVFGVWLRSGRRLDLLLVAGFAFDSMLATALVVLTGQFESPFTYLFVIVALYSGALSGPRGGAQSASFATIGVLLVAAFELDIVDATWALRPPEGPSSSPIFRAVSLIGASYGVGILAGLLRARLESTTRELAESERDIAALQSLHERILDNLRSGVVTLGRRGTVTYANPAGCRLFGRSGEALIGETMESLGVAPPTDDSRWESDLVGSDGGIVTLGLSSARLPLEGGVEGRLVTFQDLTELRRAERQLAHHERLATVGRFAAGIAHEIRNPLAAVSGAVEMLALDNTDDNDETATLTRIIGTEIDRLNDLVREILNYAGPRNVTRGRVDVPEELNETAVLFRSDPLADEVDLTLEAEGGLIAFADPEVIRQVMLNLWRNAAEVMLDADCSSKQIRVVATQSAGEVVMIVEDSGPGVPTEVAESIFEPFFTTRDSGTGLGLSTVFQLVSEVGGEVHLLMEQHEKRTLEGAAFEVRLPSAGSDQMPALSESLVELD